MHNPKHLKKFTVQPLPAPECQEIIILGITDTGAVFRPSDWAERLCGVVSHFSRDQRIRYSPHVTPIVADGVKCVVIDARLQTSRPDAFEFLMGFARDNGLLLRGGRGEQRPDAAEAHSGAGAHTAVASI
jgi:uncharacterized protein DUF3579